MLLDPTEWPPRYTLKKTRGARHVRIKTSLRKGLELVVPWRFNKHDVPSILETNKSWIIDQLTKLRVEIEEILATPLPTEINIPAFNHTWRVSYVPSDSTKVSLLKRPQQQEIVLLGNIKETWECKKRLRAWLKSQAKQHLISRLKEISGITGLDFKDVSIRNQRSRWGSCSSDKKISLNYNLIFLPPHLCDHILIHELCHTIHLNHSEKFWNLVATHDANWEQHNRATRKSEKFIPAWAKEFI